MKYFLILLLSLYGTGFSAAQEKLTAEQYIETYKKIAVSEMYRSGIPASIKMAQGLLESNKGNSRLATEGNNHFGIKCKKGWTGKTIYEDDDEKHECFRGYASASESFMDHSAFLMGNPRYAFLFDYDKTDYKNWANGLKQAGYATNPKYPALLIDIIERHRLHELDKMKLEDVDKQQPPKKDTPVTPPPVITKQPNQVFVYNKIPAVRVSAGETVVSIAKSNEMMPWQIRKYNDLSRGYDVSSGEIIYLKPKKRKGSAPFHTVQSGESMWSISQTYGIKVKHLYKKNRLDRKLEEQPAPGEVIYLQKKREEEPKLRGTEKIPEKKVVLAQPVKTNDTIPNPQEVKKTGQVQPVITEKPAVTPKEARDTANIPREKINHDEKLTTHTVVPGETLFSIAKRYQMSVDQIADLNNLQGYAIKVGQELVINGNFEEKKPDTKTTDFFHEVKAGETLYAIARKYNTTVEQLKELNHLGDTPLSVGQKLYLSKAPATEKKQETPVNAPKELHTVEKGDTLYSIAKKYNITVEQLKALNNMQDNTLSIGQQLRVK